MRLHLRLQRRRRRRLELRQLQLDGELGGDGVERLDRAFVERRAVGRVRHDRARRPVAQLERSDRGGAERAGGVPALGSDAERRKERLAPRNGLVYGTHRPVARAVVVGARPDEGEHALRVGDGDCAVPELLEELVGDRARSGLCQAAPELRQRRLEQLERRLLAPWPADAWHAGILQSEATAVRRARPGST